MKLLDWLKCRLGKPIIEEITFVGKNTEVQNVCKICLGLRHNNEVSDQSKPKIDWIKSTFLTSGVLFLLLVIKFEPKDRDPNLSSLQSLILDFVIIVALFWLIVSFFKERQQFKSYLRSFGPNNPEKEREIKLTEFDLEEVKIWFESHIYSTLASNQSKKEKTILFNNAKTTMSVFQIPEKFYVEILKDYYQNNKNNETSEVMGE